MKCRFFLFLCLFSFGTGFSQKSVLDSLKKELAKAPVDKKIDVYQAIIIKLWLNHPDTAMIYAKEAVNFAKGVDGHTQAIAVRLMCGVFYYQVKYDSAIKYGYKALK